ncbi:MAG: oligopeptide/dipeptide ABC transporter ATP-binding protein [Chloroflexota bacterium]|nr:oligopeptide/dipeptide ABC transporter ATP-binding protein [Chloroflexota bacterium]
MPEPVLEVIDLKKHFPVRSSFLGMGRASQWVRAVDGISFSVGEGETLGVVGESGCGKTTTAKLILAQESATSGEIRFQGQDVTRLKGNDLMEYRRSVQVVFQDPFSSLSPRMRVGDIISEPLEVHTDWSRGSIKSRVGEVLELVGLQPEQASLFPHEFSGGQRQRIAIARALATEAKLIILDEPVSALDVSIRAHILTLLEDLQKQLGVSYVFIGHDLAAVAHISHRIAVMYLGKVVEMAESLALCNDPQHPYTQVLFAASLPSHPDEDTEVLNLSGEVPSAINPPAGCSFHPRCQFAMAQCSQFEPVQKTLAIGHMASCHLHEGK